MKPLHLSLVGGDPLVRYRELQTMAPQLTSRGIHVQIVSGSLKQNTPEWAAMPRITVVVSIDGLQPEHDVRGAPATYQRILKNIAGQKVTIHCTITGQMLKRPGYLRGVPRLLDPQALNRRPSRSVYSLRKSATGCRRCSRATSARA